MLKTIVPLALCVLVGIAPVRADETSSDTKATPTDKASQGSVKTKSTAKATTKAPIKAGASKDSALRQTGELVGSTAERTAALVSGFMIGTPIAVARLSWQANAEQAKAIPYSETGIKPWRLFSRVLVAPTSFFSGLVSAPVASAENSWKESGDTPFGKKNFYLGDVEPFMQ